MVSKVLHMIDTKWSKTSRNVAMIKFGVILKIIYRRYENVIFILTTLKLHYFDYRLNHLVVIIIAAYNEPNSARKFIHVC